MRAFQAISTILLLIAIFFLLFDLMYQWSVNSTIKVLSIEELWSEVSKSNYESVRSFFGTFIPADKLSFIVRLPAAFVLLAISAAFYLPFRILSFLGVGKEEE